MQFFFIFVCIKLAATPPCSPGPKEAGRGAFSAIQRISTKYMQFDFSTLFDFKPMHVTGTTYTFRFYDFYPRNYEETYEKTKFSIFTTSRGKIRPSLKIEEATLIYSTSNKRFTKNKYFSKFTFPKYSKKRKRSNKKQHNQKNYINYIQKPKN